MSYEPTVWKTGDIVSSEKLNKLEEGVAGAGSGSGGQGVKVLMFDTNRNHGFVKSADTYYSFDEIKNMLIEDPNQILAYFVSSNATCMPTVPVFVPAGSQSPFAEVPDVDTIYLRFFVYVYGLDGLTFDLYKYTQNGSISMSQTDEIGYPLTRWTPS